MTLYVVHIEIDCAVVVDWQSWMMETHLSDVLATGCFHDVTMVSVPESETGERTSFQMHYLAISEDALQRYLSTEAIALQKEHSARYAGNFQARRELLPVVCRRGTRVDTGLD
jgi:hypothetical protein